MLGRIANCRVFLGKPFNSIDVQLISGDVQWCISPFDLQFGKSLQCASEMHSCPGKTNEALDSSIK